MSEFDLDRAFTHARMFDDSSRELFSHRHPYYLLVCMTSSAFACEIYLKCLLNIYGISAKGHDLSKLLNQLSAEEIKTLNEIYACESNSKFGLYSSNEDPETLSMSDLLILANSWTFTKIRYEYEYNNSRDLKTGEHLHYRLLFSVNDAIKERLLYLRPELKKNPEYQDIKGTYIIKNTSN